MDWEENTNTWMKHPSLHCQISSAKGNLCICLADILLFSFLPPQPFSAWRVAFATCCSLEVVWKWEKAELLDKMGFLLSNILQWVVGVTHPCPPRVTLHRSENQVRCQLPARQRRKVYEEFSGVADQLLKGRIIYKSLLQINGINGTAFEHSNLTVPSK